MKINSVTTQEIDLDGRILATSKKTFKKKPEVSDYYKSPWFQTSVFDAIEQHSAQFTLHTSAYIVTVSTSKGKFVKSFGRPHVHFR